MQWASVADYDLNPRLRGDPCPGMVRINGLMMNAKSAKQPMAIIHD